LVEDTSVEYAVSPVEYIEANPVRSSGTVGIVCRLWIEVDVAHFDVLSRISPGEAEKSHEKPKLE
jgi:hypothetical protein